MEISFTCPHCKAPIEANGDTAGDRMQCPACAETVLVPAGRITPGLRIAGFRV